MEIYLTIRAELLRLASSDGSAVDIEASWGDYNGDSPSETWIWHAPEYVGRFFPVWKNADGCTSFDSSTGSPSRTSLF